MRIIKSRLPDTITKDIKKDSFHNLSYKHYDDFYKTFITKTASMRVDDNNNIVMNNVYSNIQNRRFEMAFRQDPVVRLGIIKKVDFIIGERPITVLDTNQEFALRDKAIEAFNNITGNKVYQEMKIWIDNVNKKVSYHEKLKAAMVSMKVFGRSVIAIEWNELDMPEDLKVLNSQNLGEVTVANDSWKLLSVQYTDSNNAQGTDKNKNIINAEDMIYFTNLNYNITPDTLFSGYSDIETIVDISECNRIIDQMDLKESNTKGWSGQGLIKFMDTKDPVVMKQWLSNWKPGTWMASDANVDVSVFNLKTYINELVSERTENDRRLARGLDVPSFLVNFEDITNRSVVKSVLEAWKSGTIIPQRIYLKNIVEPQWLDRLTMRFLNNRNIKKIKVRVKQEFEDIMFDTVKDQVEAYMPLYEQDLVNPDRFLRLIGLDSIADEAKLLENEMIQRREQLKSEISLGIDRYFSNIISSGEIKEELSSEIDLKMMKNNMLNEITAKIEQQDASMIKDYIDRNIRKKISK